jgi:hypothetical protein
MQSSQDRRPSRTRRLPRRPTDRVEDAAAWVLAAVALFVARWGLDRRNAARWAEEWARVGPQWSGHSH